MGHGSTAFKNFRPISTNMQSKNLIDPHVQEIKTLELLQLGKASTDTDTIVSAIALSVLSYRRAKKTKFQDRFS